jgi:uncharacterized protein YecE (DUF72 family)
MEDGSILIGTSGWAYDHWQGPFYPGDCPTADRLSYYAAHFRSVEINNSFYQLPSAETLVQWRETVPAGFTFAFKANRYLTHMKKLSDPGEPLRILYDRASVLGDALGPILFQLPPNWDFDPDRLSSFLDALSPRFRHAVELRDERWVTPEALDLLRRHETAFCIYDFAGRLSPRAVTADVVYVRLHGPLEKPYRGRYDPQTLSGWAGALSTWRRQGRDVFCYFDNDEAGYAPTNALTLQEMLT